MTPGPSQSRGKVALHHRRYVPSMYAYSRDQEPLSQKTDDDKKSYNMSNFRNDNLKTSQSFTRIQKPQINEAIIEILSPDKEEDDKRIAEEHSASRNEKKRRSKSAIDGNAKMYNGKMFIVNWNKSNQKL